MVENDLNLVAATKVSSNILTEINMVRGGLFEVATLNNPIPKYLKYLKNSIRPIQCRKVFSLIFIPQISISP